MSSNVKSCIYVCMYTWDKMIANQLADPAWLPGWQGGGVWLHVNMCYLWIRHIMLLDWYFKKLLLGKLKWLWDNYKWFLDIWLKKLKVFLDYEKKTHIFSALCDSARASECIFIKHLVFSNKFCCVSSKWFILRKNIQWQSQIFMWG